MTKCWLLESPRHFRALVSGRPDSGQTCCSLIPGRMQLQSWFVSARQHSGSHAGRHSSDGKHEFCWYLKCGLIPWAPEAVYQQVNDDLDTAIEVIAAEFFYSAPRPCRTWLRAKEKRRQLQRELVKQGFHSFAQLEAAFLSSGGTSFRMRRQTAVGAEGSGLLA